MPGMPLLHPVPDSVLARIGDVTVSFALLESQLEMLAGSLLGLQQPVTRAITADLNAPALRDLILSVYRESRGEDDDFADLAALVSRAKGATTERNKIVHALWAAGRDADSVTQIGTTAKGGKLNTAFDEKTADAIAKVALDIRSVAEDVQTFTLKRLDGPPLTD